MKRIEIIFCVVAAVMLGACNSTYPDSFIEDNSVVKANDGDIDDVLVQISLTDPLYSVYTRGVGGFSPWAEDSAHWLNAPFHVYAYATNNGIQGRADYQEDSLCLINDHIARLEGEYGQMWFTDAAGNQENVYYKKSQYNVRYRFFMYHADDAVLGPLQVSGNTATRSITIDGSQDIIHGMDQPTETQINEAASVLGMTTKEVVSYLYSYRAGKSGMNPIVPINHLLCQMDVVVKGAPVNNVGTSGWDYRYQRVIIDTVSIVAPTKAVLTVAKDAWTSETYQQEISSGKVLEPEEDSLSRIRIRLRRNQAGDNQYTQLYNPHISFSSLIKDMKAQGIHASDDEYNHLNMRYDPSGDAGNDTLTSISTLLMPRKQYLMRLGGYWADNIDSSGTHCTWRSLPLGFIRINTTDGSGFKAGHHYTVVINMYGPQKAEVGAIVDEWTEGGVVHVSTISPDPYSEN